jgi:hypothetical protein
MAASSERAADDDIIDSVAEFCDQQGIKADGLTALTVQENHGSRFASIIVDFPNRVILPVYPKAAELENYTDKISGALIFAYNDHLPPVDQDALSPVEARPFKFPCCSAMKARNPRRLDAEKYFTDFVKGSGHHANVVFEVKRQVNFGAMIDTTYHQLLHGERVEVHGHFTEKIHAFKNYTCADCNLFFGLDLYRKSGSGSNAHHMRTSPFSKHTELLPELFKLA